MKYLIDKEVLNNRLAFFTVPTDIWEAIQHTPIVDAVPVRHGQWLDGYHLQTCSSCKYRGRKSWKYCPNCGADMRGEQE